MRWWFDRGGNRDCISLASKIRNLAYISITLEYPAGLDVGGRRECEFAKTEEVRCLYALSNSSDTGAGGVRGGRAYTYCIPKDKNKSEKILGVEWDEIHTLVDFAISTWLAIHVKFAWSRAV